MNPIDDLIAKSMSALLEDAAVKAAVLDYLAVLTEAAKPRPEPARWQKVWEEVSLETRTVTTEHLKVYGFSHTARLYVIALHNKDEEIGRIMASPVNEDFDFTNPFRSGMWDEQRQYGGELIYNHLMTAKHYMQVVLYAQSCMPKVLALWDTKLVEPEKIP